MAYNKSKYIDAAQKYLHQGKVPQAIAEYQNILKHEPKDQVTLMTIGDLYVRQGETFRALEYFERLAQIFLQDGFTTKAIAIYKKVAKLAPEESRPLERLAELYVQQGVLSEARPIFLQLAEMHLRAGRQPQAAALLRKLLEAEPENLRVQVRLAELYLTMGQQKEALETFLSAAQRVMERGDQAEAVRLTDRTLQLEPQNRPALLLKAQALSASGKNPEAIGLLEPHTDEELESDNAKLLFDLYLANSQTDKGAELAEQMFAHGAKNYAPAHQLAGVLLEAGDLDRAQRLLGLIRNAMADAGEHDLLSRSLTRLADARPAALEPAEWLVELYAKKNDASRWPGAQLRVARALVSNGKNTKALEAYEQLLNRASMDPTATREYANLRSSMGLESAPSAAPSGAIPTTNYNDAAAPTARAAFDEEAQRYVMQALTDVDLFSSYGLTQKAVELLEEILRRAPQHTPALERLLDLSVAAGNDLRTVELASSLEQLAVEGGDDAAAERYAELRRRFQRGSGTSPSQPAVPQSFSVPHTASPTFDVSATLVPSADGEFSVPVIEAELIEADETQEKAADHEPMAAAPFHVAPPLEAAVHEVDLSQEWAALSQQLEESVHPGEAAKSNVPLDAVAEEPIEVAEVADASALESEPILDEDPTSEFELRPAEESKDTPLSADELFSDLSLDLASAADFLGAQAHEAGEQPPQQPVHDVSVHNQEASLDEAVHLPQASHAAAAPKKPAEVASGNGVATNGASSGPLGDLFDQFRSDLGDSGVEQEDPETHYNLGVAYREMGLLDEAISEFQKVYKGDKAQAFRYSMQCCTLLALAFREKGQPAIAAMWYERALLTPGLEQESILALRYDLGVAQEMAGETDAAFKSFSQVYAMNIDYRDVAERVALLGKAR